MNMLHHTIHHFSTLYIDQAKPTQFKGRKSNCQGSLSSYSEMPSINQTSTLVIFNQSSLIRKRIIINPCPLEWRVLLKNSHIQVRF